MKNAFYFMLKARSGNIDVFVMTFWLCKKTARLKSYG